MFFCPVQACLFPLLLLVIDVQFENLNFPGSKLLSFFLLFFLIFRCKTRFCYRCGRKLPIGCSCERGSSYDCMITILIIVGMVVGLGGMILLGKYGKEDDIAG